MKTRSRTNNEPLLKRKPPRGNKEVELLSKNPPDSVLTKTPTGKEKKLKTPNSKDKRRAITREDLICSQHFDSQVVVGWDCNSPDTVRNLNRLANDDKEDDLLSRLIADEPEDEFVVRKRSTPPLLGLWRDHEKLEVEPNEKNALLPNRTRKRVRTRKKSAKDSVSQALLQKLERALDKCSKTDKETEPRVAEGEHFPSECDEEAEENEYNANASGDLFDCCATETNIDSTVGPASLSYKDKEAGPTVEIGGDIGSDVEWSDNDLFEEDSFLVKPTQVTIEPKKSQVFGMKRKPFRDNDLPQSKCFRASPRHNSEKVVQSATVNKYTMINSKGSDSCDNKSKLGVQTQPPLIHTATGSASTSKTWAKTVATSSVWPKTQPSVPTTSSKSQVGVSQPGSVNRNGPNVSSSSVGRYYNTSVSKNVSMFGKQNVSSSYPTNSGANNGAKTNQGTVSQSKNSAFKKHSSFSGTSSPTQNSTSSRKRSISGNTNTFAGTKTYPSSTVTTSHTYGAGKNYSSYNSNIARTKTNSTVMYQTSASKPQSAISPSRSTRLSNSSFDTSLSDDLLCQLAEPDDVLDSQLDVSKLPNKPVQVSNTNKKVEVLNDKPCDNSVMKNLPYSQNQTQNKQYRFKTSQKLPAAEKQHTFPVPVASKQTGVASKVQSTSNQSTVATQVKKMETVVEEDMIADDMLDDDGFSDDEALTEPQILAMLDEVELLATQQCATNNRPNNNGDNIKSGQERLSNSQEQMFSSQNFISNSPDLVNNNKAQINSSQGHSGSQCHNSSQGQGHSSSQGHSSQGQGHSSSQGQVSGSQAKYTAAEIERKKLEAIQKRKLRSQMKTS